MKRIYLLLVALVVGATFAAPSSSRAQTDPLCFDVSDTTRCTTDRFLDYWRQYGSLAVFGLPISAADMITNRDTGSTDMVQWFERNRFELHPEAPAPYDVLLGRLGDERLRQLGIDWQALPRERGPQPNCLWFEQTGHNVCDQEAGLGFKTYWQTHGLSGSGFDAHGSSLALFGFPLTTPRMETNSSGYSVLTQWFERARFEWHPDQPNEFKVLLGLLGTEVYTIDNRQDPALHDQGLTFVPVADAFVSISDPDHNFGGEPFLAVDANVYRATYLKFQIDGIRGRVRSATLKVYVVTDPIVNGGSSSGGSVRLVPDSSWEEHSITYTTRPPLEQAVLATLGAVKRGGWYTFDVTGAVPGDGIVSLSLTSQNGDGAYYTSREVKGFEPQLTITLAP